MDAIAFDALSRMLSSAGSRRRVLTAFRGVLSLTLGTASLQETEGKKKKCPPCKKRNTRGKCKKNKADGTGCAGGTCQGGSCLATVTLPPPLPPALPATCSDGIQNGSETAIDCGGPACPRCGVGQPCGGPTDCSTALCVNGVCAACGIGVACGNDSKGPCSCRGGVCFSLDLGSIASSCDDCPLYWDCFVAPGGQVIRCIPPCGDV